MGRPSLAVQVRALARCSQSTPTAQPLLPCMGSPLGVVTGLIHGQDWFLRSFTLSAKPLFFPLIPTATELPHMAVWFCRAIPSMGQQAKAGLGAMAQCSKSIQTARVSQTCICSVQHPLVFLPLTATEPF